MTTSTPTTQRTLYILYNANSTLLGKLHYGYRKLRPGKSNSPQNPACAACDITHGGLSLSESPKWTESKKEIERAGNLKVSQLHRDEVAQRKGSKGLDGWIKERGVSWPSVVLGRVDASEKGGEEEVVDGGEVFELVVDRDELITCGGRPEDLVRILREKGVLGGVASL